MSKQIKYKTLSGKMISHKSERQNQFKIDCRENRVRLFILFMRKSCFLLLGFLLCTVVEAQNLKTNNTFVALPIVYFTPETNWAFGAGGSYTFYLDSLRQRPSTIQLGGVYTLRKQFLSYLSFNLFHPDKRWEMAGELGYYNYVYKYWGTGNRIAGNEGESYEVTYPRLRIFPKYFVSDYWRIGLAADINKYSRLKLKEGGQLDQQQAVGIKGGYVNGVGLQIQYDSREHTIFPVRGWYISSKAVYYNHIWGSDYTFTSTELDIRNYQNIAGGVIWASQFLATFRSGPEIPFYHLSLLGGPKMMRGYFEGRYRDNNLWALQTEFRLPIWRRFFLVSFGSAGDVFDFEKYNRSIKFAGGMGLRYIVDHANRVNIRADVAYGQNFQFYLSILEAF